MNDESRSGSPVFDCDALRRQGSAKVQYVKLSAPKTAVVGPDSTYSKRQFVGRHNHRPGCSPVSLLSFLEAENSKLRKAIVELSLHVNALRRLLEKDRPTSNIFGDAAKLTRNKWRKNLTIVHVRDCAGTGEQLLMGKNATEVELLTAERHRTQYGPTGELSLPDGDCRKARRVQPA